MSGLFWLTVDVVALTLFLRWAVRRHRPVDVDTGDLARQSGIPAQVADLPPHAALHELDPRYSIN